MSGDRRRGVSLPELQPADQGPSKSNDRFRNARNNGAQSLHSASSASTAHRAVFSIATSQMTNTDDSAHSVEMNQDSLDPILLRVYGEQAATNPMLLCHRRNVTPRFLRSYSVKLVDGGRRERIDNENCLVVHVPSTVSSRAFRLMVDNIGKLPSVTPRNSPMANISFSDFFVLCIVLWSYVCKIDHWVAVAEHIRDLDWKDDFKQWPAGRLTQWLFVALVFDWPDIFEIASKALIVDFSELDAELFRAEYLPDEVISAMTNTRRDYMRKTYDEIRSISLHLNDDHHSRLLSLPHEIRADLLQAPGQLDLHKHLPEDTHKSLSPGEVLKSVRQTITKARSVPPAPTLVRHPTGSPTQPSTPSSVHSDTTISLQQRLTEISRTTRTAEGGEALFEVLQDVWRVSNAARKRRFGRKSSSMNLDRQQAPPESAEPPPLTPQEIDTLYTTLLTQLDDFQTTHLRPLNIDDFSLLRAQHVLSAPAP